MQNVHVVTPSDNSAERAPRRVVPLSTLLGAVLGCCYGVAIRIWMRFISADPEFTWAGTLGIIVGFTVTFALAGLVAGGRRRGWKAAMVPARVAAIVVSLACFGAAGLVMLPTIVSAALAIARIDWPIWLRRVLAAVAAFSVVGAFSDTGHLSVLRLVAAIAVYLALVAIEVRVFVEPYRPTVSRLPMAVKIVVAGIGVFAAAAVVRVAVDVLDAS